jgi:predicted RNase H-like HicB family nuclease
MKKIEFKVSLPVSIMKEGKLFVAHTSALDISTSGKTEKEVKKRFQEIVSIFLEEIMEKGTLEEVLRDFGWKKIQKQWNPPTLISQQSEEISIYV